MYHLKSQLSFWDPRFFWDVLRQYNASGLVDAESEPKGKTDV